LVLVLVLALVLILIFVLYFRFVLSDLNPHSYKYLELNANQNHCGKWLKCYNLDGREFVYQLASKGITFDHAILNLPSTAISFLDCFIGLGYRINSHSAAGAGAGAGSTGCPAGGQPRVHVYAFSNAEDPALDVVQRAAAVLQCAVSDFGPAPYVLQKDSEVNDKTTVHIVRDVAPKKHMVCLSFTLPLEVSMRAIQLDTSAISSSSSSSSSIAVGASEEEPAEKKRRVD
jgi:tRNA (guanine37-N1)-methyltransferase